MFSSQVACSRARYSLRSCDLRTILCIVFGFKSPKKHIIYETDLCNICVQYRSALLWTLQLPVSASP